MPLFKPKVISSIQVNCDYLEDDFKKQIAGKLVYYLNDIISIILRYKSEISDGEVKILEEYLSELKEIKNNENILNKILSVKFKRNNPILINVYSNGDREAICPYVEPSPQPHHSYCSLRFLYEHGPNYAEELQCMQRYGKNYEDASWSERAHLVHLIQSEFFGTSGEFDFGMNTTDYIKLPQGKIHRYIKQPCPLNTYNPHYRHIKVYP